MEIGRKIYYSMSMGQVLVITSEMSGDVSATTTDQDFTTYPTLQGVDPSTVGCIQLDYGQYADQWATGYVSGVDPTAKTLNWTEYQPI